MSIYKKLSVKAVETETAQAVVVTLDIPEDLRTDFAFKAGQYVSLRSDIDGQDVRRSYSICTSPGQGVLQIGVKKVPGGLFSTYANERLKAGDILEVMPPQGNFTHITDAEATSTYVFFAAGSGITPVISLIKDILETESESKVVLFYGNRSSESIMFKEELEGLKNTYLTRLSLHFILSKERQSAPFYNGRIDRDKCETFSKAFFDTDSVVRYFLCGPEEMINDVSDWLTSSGVDKERIAFELFTTPTSKPFKTVSEDIKQNFDPEKESMVTVRVDGDAVEFRLAYGAENILDAAIQAGVDVPFSCKGGVCCTCKGMLMEGEVDMDVVYGLEPDEVEDGYILTCQAHPRSDTILVDYDV